MPRPPATTEERVIKALRDAKAITGPEQDAAIAALTATETCTKCGGTGNTMPEGAPPWCDRCESTGQQYVIR
jgi:DnaJ-class molecular chaperone